MKEYKLIIADDVDFDIEEAIERKEEYGAYQSTIDELLETSAIKKAILRIAY